MPGLVGEGGKDGFGLAALGDRDEQADSDEIGGRLYETAAAGRPVASGLEPLGIELGVPELVDVAATGALATTKGAPVSRSLLAKTQSLRNTLSADTEQIARDRSVKLQIPLVLMGFITIATGIYPAVGAIHH